MARRANLLAWGVAMCAAVGGCAESEYVAVQGQVFYRDKPLTSGVIMFQPSHGPPSRSDISADGSFALATPGGEDGARVGLNKVRISSREAPRQGDTELALGKLLIPERYTNFESSGLVAEVQPGANEPFVFRLED